MRDFQFHVLLSSLFMLGYHLDDSNGWLLLTAIAWLALAGLDLFVEKK